jgi:hypothetical protein
MNNSMKVEILERISVEHVIEHIRSTPLMGVPGFLDRATAVEKQNKGDQEIKNLCTFPYETADIIIKRVRPIDLLPTSYYGLREGVKKQLELREALKDKGLDNFMLGTGTMSNRPGQDNVGGLVFRVDDTIYTIIPTISEFPIDVRYGRIDRLMLVDGHHRMFHGKEKAEHVSTAEIRGVTTPFYAMANPCGWDDYILGEAIPPNKKAYSHPNPYSLYRNFDHGFVLPNHYPSLRENRINASAPR